MEPHPRIHDNGNVLPAVQVYYERIMIKGKQRGYEQQEQGGMTKENKGKWKIIENNNNTKGLPLQVFYHVLSCSFMRLIRSVTFWHVLCESYSISHVLLLDLLPGINTARCSPSCTVVLISSTLLPECV